MTEQFFYQDGGKTVGPVSASDLKERIRDGRLRLFDLILKEGEAGWRMALEHQDLRHEFKDQSVLNEKPWICLKRKSKDGFDFYTIGPFSREDVRESLLAGRIEYTDYVWRQGFEEWRRIGLVEDFNPRMKRRAADEIEEPPPEEADELLRKVVSLKRPTPPIPEERPPEATGPDLTQASIPVLPKKVVDTAPETADSESTQTGIKITGEVKSSSRRRKNVPWFDWGIVLVLVVVLAVVAIILSRNIRRHRMVDPLPPAVVETAPPAPVEKAEIKDIQDEDEVSTPEPPQEIVAPAPSPSKPAPAPQAKNRKPTELYLTVQNRSGREARIELRTNGSSDFPVYLQIVGLPGHNSEGPAYYRYVRLKPPAEPMKLIDLSDIRLPMGRYILRAQTGELKRETKLSLGVNDPEYKSAVARQRRLHAHALWSERISLFQAAGLLETRISEAVQGKKFSTKGLERAASLKSGNGSKYLFFEEWSELKDILTEASTKPSPQLSARARKVREKMSTYSVWK